MPSASPGGLVSRWRRRTRSRRNACASTLSGSSTSDTQAPSLSRSRSTVSHGATSSAPKSCASAIPAAVVTSNTSSERSRTSLIRLPPGLRCTDQTRQALHSMSPSNAERHHSGSGMSNAIAVAPACAAAAVAANDRDEPMRSRTGRRNAEPYSSMAARYDADATRASERAPIRDASPDCARLVASRNDPGAALRGRLLPCPAS